MAIFNSYVANYQRVVASSGQSVMFGWVQPYVQRFTSEISWLRWDETDGWSGASNSWLKHMCRLLCPLFWQIPEQSYIQFFYNCSTFWCMKHSWPLFWPHTGTVTMFFGWSPTDLLEIRVQCWWKIQLRIWPDSIDGRIKHLTRSPDYLLYIYIGIITYLYVYKYIWYYIIIQ